MKKKLSKQTIFTILGILVIAASIPMAVLLVKQRQEIRKEAATCSPPNSRIDACHYCGANGYSGLDFSTGGERDWCGCTLTYFGRTAEYVSRCGGGSPAVATPPPASGGQACGSWCQSQVGHSAPPWCRNDANPDPGYTLKGCTSSGISDNSYCCAFTQNVAAPPPTTQPPAASSPTTSCTPGQWNSSLCTRCLSNGQWPQGGIACPAGNLDFGSRNLDGDAGYTDQAHCDCQRRCWGADKMTVNCGGTVPIESVPGNENVSGSERGWGLYKTGVDCPAPAQQQAMPTPTPTTPPPLPTPTLTKPTVTPTVTPTLTPTPTMPLSCNEPCTTNSQCSGSLICSSGHCRKSDCVNEIDCTCPGPTPTPTVTPTITPTPTTPVGCNQTCTTNSNCQSSLICSSGYCRNVDCTGETDCSCPGPTATPTPGPTSTPGPTTTPGPTNVLAQATPTPVVELPKAGFTLPTFGFVLGGILLIITSLVFIL